MPPMPTTVIPTEHPWCQRLLAPLSPEEMQRADTLWTDPRWEYLEEQARKLGTLQQSSVDRDQVCELALQLLEHRSKDLRLLALLIRALLPTTQDATALLACQLLRVWWQCLAPGGAQDQHHLRLLRQTLERLVLCCERLPTVSDQTRWQLLCAESEQLQALNHLSPPELQRLALRLSTAVQQSGPSVSSPMASIPVAPSTTSAPQLAPNGVDEQHQHPADPSPRSWRQTLLLTAAQLCQQDPANPLGYRLRRHAIWSHIRDLPEQSAPQRTTLSPPDRDRIADYRAALRLDGHAVWPQVEQSTTVTPYWFDGHALSAQIASLLGFTTVALAIRQELNQLLQRLPQLRNFHFADGTPFLSDESAAWLAGENQTPENPAHAQSPEEESVIDLALLDASLRTALPLKERFQLQYQLARQLEQQQNIGIAALYYDTLRQQARQISLYDWEPELLNRLNQACLRCPMP